jgi:hypothetical protein
MSSPTSSPISSQPASVERWKRKYEALEAQYAISKDFGPKTAAYVIFVSICFSLMILATSVTANQKKLGRGFRRMVDMFTSVRDLVDENDRHIESLADGGESGLNEE